jgi:hypothetical protein
LGSNGVAKFVSAARPTYHGVGKPETENGGAVHGEWVAAQYRFDLLPRHARFQRHINYA